MAKENSLLVQEAKESLNGKWGLAIGTYLVYMLIVGVVIFIFSFTPYVGDYAASIVTLLIGGPFALGIAIFALSISRNQDASLNQIFQGFNYFGKAFYLNLLIGIFTFLWMLLLIVPGIIKALSYSMAFFIFADDGAKAPMNVIYESKKMMYGYKGKLFCLYLRFFGLLLLCILTLGIGFLWLLPYMQVTMAKFYEDVKMRQE